MKRGDVHHVFLHSANILVTRKPFSFCEYFTLEINSFLFLLDLFPPLDGAFFFPEQYIIEATHSGDELLVHVIRWACSDTPASSRVLH